MLYFLISVGEVHIVNKNELLISHNFGLQPDPQDITSFTPNGGYEYGYHMPGGYVTIMAYTATGFTTRVAYFSSPDLFYGDDNIPTGTANRYLDTQHIIPRL